MLIWSMFNMSDLLEVIKECFANQSLENDAEKVLSYAATWGNDGFDDMGILAYALIKACKGSFISVECGPENLAIEIIKYISKAENMRQCNTCHEFKTEEEFREDNLNPNCCKQCNRKVARAWQDRLQRTKNLLGLTRDQIRGLPQEKRLHMMASADNYNGQ